MTSHDHAGSTPDQDTADQGAAASRRPSFADTSSACCGEYSGLSRRGLLGGMLVGGMLAAVYGTTHTQVAYGATNSNVLVVVSLRGAADGLSLVVPHGDSNYYAARPGIAVPKEQLLARDAQFGLHPSFAPLLGMWRAGKVAAVHATGLPAPNRSHFAAMEEIEDADPGSAARIGWINRLIGTDKITTPLQGVQLGTSAPTTALYGPQRTVTTASVDSMELSGADKWDTNDGRTKSLHTLWGKTPGVMGAGGRTALKAVRDFGRVHKTSTTPANGATYPDDDLGKALRDAARVIRGNVGARVIAVDHDGGWDMHTHLGRQGGGAMGRATSVLASSLAAFFTDLGSLGNRVTVVTISEFGRRMKENSSGGLDHGHGNVMLLLGAGVKGGYYGTWPETRTSVDADLRVTTDYRHVLSEIAVKRMGASTAKVFPHFPARHLGILTR